MPVDLRSALTSGWWALVEVKACAARALGALYGVMIELMRESPWIGANAALTASLNAESPTDKVVLEKMRTKFDVAGLPDLRAVVMRLPAPAHSRLLGSGPPPASLPPLSKPATRIAPRTPRPAGGGPRAPSHTPPTP